MSMHMHMHMHMHQQGHEDEVKCLDIESTGKDRGAHGNLTTNQPHPIGKGGPVSSRLVEGSNGYSVSYQEWSKSSIGNFLSVDMNPSPLF